MTELTQPHIPEWLLAIYHRLQLEHEDYVGRLDDIPPYEYLLKSATFLMDHLHKSNIPSIMEITPDNLAQQFSKELYNNSFDD